MLTETRILSVCNQKNRNYSQQQVMSKFADSADVKLGNWDSLVKALVRPPRQEYKLSQLGSSLLNFKGTVYKHSQFNTKHQGKNIQVTLYEPVDCECKYVILYLHGNSASRLEGLTLQPGLPSTYALASFDFMGCGLSTEEFISLGVFESEQIGTVVKSLEDKGFKVILWGRSMGASSALKYGGTFITVADSPFSSMERMCRQTAISKAPSYIPSCLMSCLFPCVFYKLRADVKKVANFDLKDLNIQKSVREIDPNKVLIFIAATQDSLIRNSHSQRLYDAFRGKDKRIFKVSGNHNTKRPDETYEQIFQYIKRIISLKQNPSEMDQIPPNPVQEVKKDVQVVEVEMYQEPPGSSQGIVVNINN